MPRYENDIVIVPDGTLPADPYPGLTRVRRDTFAVEIFGDDLTWHGATATVVGGVANGPRYYFLTAEQTPKAQSANAWVYSTQTTGGAYAVGLIGNPTSPAIGDFVTLWDVWLDAGTWAATMLGTCDPTGGIVQTQLLGPANLTFPSTQDQYAATQGFKRDDIGTVTVASAGLYAVKVSVTGKNASATSTRCRLSGVILTRTA